ncbi:CheR family methyltransferase [Chitinimonas koreensis]|uniref:CheR family methyltransferase n=1 Tax=Chitinimonas koreensis TaxID=356302 RepID=UPI00041B17C4|nr:protein-glutamate O-methyltransferase CheR [Chitinimonas koreensis]QNM95998.1 protein-glutamate O-methyltransferase CheR [Chitinimonas koreensis]
MTLASPLILPAGFTLEPMSDADFARYQALLERLTGIHLAPIKKAMLSGRLAKRLRDRGVNGYGEYFALIDDGGEAQERQIAIDLVTTNETYFFREPKHFDALRERFLPGRQGQPIRVWSAACASGEESYSLAMTLADALGDDGPWEIHGSDISSRVLATAGRGLYPMERAHHIPPHYLKRYCLRGTGDYMGDFLITRELRRHVRFHTVNLIRPLPPELGRFDLVFLRNVIIYFDADTKRRVVESVAATLKPGGWLVVGHSESLLGAPVDLQMELPTIYRKPG